jgi:hypothetical protein
MARIATAERASVPKQDAAAKTSPMAQGAANLSSVLLAQLLRAQAHPPAGRAAAISAYGAAQGLG